MKKEMNLKDIQKYQADFDNKFFSKYWNKKKDTKWKIDFLKDMTIALTGELGEFANVIKKIDRDRKALGEEASKERIDKLKEELTDCFIYMIILSNILEMDIEKQFLSKVRLNEKRFQKYLK
jgi:NTP pyrophosphatase (non-canonical NTP hydrolase)